MKSIAPSLLALVLIISMSTTVFATNSNVTFDGHAKDFVFEPGSDESLTDLFPNFKGVMPGDKLNQKITIKNDDSDNVDVKLYIRALGAQDGSEAFLRQLNLSVILSDNSELFRAPADQTGQLSDWVCLGTFKSGADVVLDVTLEVPIEMDNTFSNAVGYLDWEFKVEEIPPAEIPETGDNFPLFLLVGLMVFSSCFLTALVVAGKNTKVPFK